MSTTNALKLKYAFTPDPNPIFASATGANPNTIDLQVIISNPTAGPIALTKISIQVPVGADTSARDLTAAASLPQATGYPSDAWKIEVSGGTIDITPVGGGSMEFGGAPLIFILPEIKVNHTAGTVPVAITEFYPAKPKAWDENTYSLVKQRANFPVSKFYADPAVVNDQEDTVKLYWECTDPKATLSYRLRCPELDWTDPADCLSDGTCYGCSIGQAGVRTPRLSSGQYDALFTFYLDVVKPSSSGHREVVATLSTIVQLCVPAVSQNSHMSPDTPGRFVSLRWLAFNASRCKVILNNAVIDSHAPVNTYHQGYGVLLPGAGEYNFTVEAVAAAGSATASHIFPEIELQTAPSTLSLAPNRAPNRLATVATPEGALGLVVCEQWTPCVKVIDVGARKVEDNCIKISGGYYDLAATPDGKLALVVTSATTDLTVIDIAARKAEPAGIKVGQMPFAIAVTPDGRLALVTRHDEEVAGYVTVVDIAARKAEPADIKVGLRPCGIAVTPDGKLALASSWRDGTVTVIDIAARKAEPATIEVGRYPSVIVVTHDGKLALVSSTTGVTVIDIAARRVVAKLPLSGTISYSWNTAGLAISPDGAFALVSIYDEKTVTVIDVATLKVMPDKLPVGGNPMGIAFTPDGVNALVCNYRDGSVTIL